MMLINSYLFLRLEETYLSQLSACRLTFERLREYSSCSCPSSSAQQQWLTSKVFAIQAGRYAQARLLQALVNLGLLNILNSA